MTGGNFMRNTKPKQEKQKEIMDAALQLFLEKGYEKTSIKNEHCNRTISLLF